MNEKIESMLQKGYGDSYISALLGVTPGAISRVRLQLSKSSGNAAKVLDARARKAVGFTGKVRELLKSFFQQEGAESYRPRMLRKLRDMGYSAEDILGIMPSATQAEVQKALSSLY